jgi:acyl-CoA thioesterase YciA
MAIDKSSSTDSPAGAPKAADPARVADDRRSRNIHADLPAGCAPVLRVVPMPADANQHGDIFGGWIMSQVDIAGGVVAAVRARGRVATVAVNSFVFREPVMIGDRVSFYANVIRVGRTSITVNVEVFAERNPAEREVVKVTEATLTYVATDSQRLPRPVDMQA